MRFVIFAFVVLFLVVYIQCRRFSHDRGYVYPNRWLRQLRHYYTKRETPAAKSPFDIELRANQCKFSSYDLNGDSVVTIAEMQTVFGFNRGEGKGNIDMIEQLFKALDLPYGNGVITESEFNANAPSLIKRC